MINSDGTVELDLDAVRQKIVAGKLRWSVVDAGMVNVVRVMVEKLQMSARDVAAELSTSVKIISHNAVISMCHRATPPIKPSRAPGFGEANVKKIVNTRKARRALSKNLSTHMVKLERVTRGDGYAAADFTLARPRVRRFNAPLRCCWCGCAREPDVPGSPYCAEHRKASGALPRVPAGGR